ncbi:hypothetical protein IJ674_01375 [bacterium]|nr:hypothetical protein [bacterium]
MRNKRFGILVLLALLSLSNCAIAEDINFDFGQDTAFEKIKANKDTISKAQEAMDNKDYQTAINLLTGYINEKQNKYEVYKLRGDAYYAIRRYYMAQKDYQTAIDIKSSEDKFMTNTKYVSAIVLGADKNEQKQNAELGDLYGALMYAQKAMNNPNYTASYDSAVKYNSHIYLPQPNKNEINKINCPQKYGKVLTPQGIDIQIYGAIDDIAKGNYNESLYKLQSVTTQYPNYYLGHYLTGVALSELEKDNDAIKEFEKAISLNPYDFESRASLGRIYYSKAETKFSQDDARKSIEYFSQALRQNHNCPTYYFYIGMNELQIGNTNVAISNFDKALKINPSDYNSQYYKLIAQYINGNYQDVIDGASKLLLKHVSNYNSVLYLRALAYTKLNENEKALADLNTIENNIGDIYNADIKTTSAREKSLESYVHYLKAQIQHSKGAGSAEDNTIAYSNPIIDRLSNAQKAMEPYEKSLHGENISLSDYNKFESFYSTSLPKLLESGAVITYEDIDNQYDYIRTTFADLGISFLYLNPDYKMTTIKDYPYKKYSSKLNRTEMQSLSARPVSDSTNVELARAQSETLRKSTPSSELILQENQSSLAQMLASDALAGKPKPMEVKNPIALRDVPVKESSTPSFKPENPDAEKVYSSKNIASGDTYVRENPLVNQDNSKNVTKILNEEKTIQTQIPEIKQETNVETASDGSVKISVNNPISTPDVVIKNKPEPIPAVAKTTTEKAEEVTETTKSLPDLEPLKFNAKEFKQTDDVVIRYPEATPTKTVAQSAGTAAAAAVSSAIADASKTSANAAQVASQTKENVKLSAKEAKKLAKEQLKAEKEAAKLAKKEAKLRLKEEKEALRLAQKEADQKLKAEQEALKLEQKEAEQLQKSAQEIVDNAKQQVEQQQDSMRQTAKSTVDSTENIIAENKPQVREIVEKHANIGSDINVQKPSNSLTIDNIDDIVELDVSTLDKKIGNESDLFDSNTVFTKPAAEVKELTPPVTIAEIPEEKPVVQQVAQTVEVKQKTVPNADSKVAVVNVPEITVPEIRAEKGEVKENKPVQTTTEQSTEQKATVQQSLKEQEPKTMQKPVTEQVSAEQIAQKTAAASEPVPAPVSESTSVQPDEKFVKEQLSQMLEQVAPKQQKDELPSSASSTMSDVEMTMYEANDLKAKRLKLKEEAKYAKAQKRAQALKEKEEKKFQKEKERIALMAQRDAIKEKEKAQKNIEKEKIAQARKELKQQKVLEKEQKKLEQQVKFEQSENKSESVVESKVEKTAQQIRAEQSKQTKKLEKKMAKQQKILEQEQEKIVEQNDETKIQRLKAKLAAMRGSLTSAEKKAQKEQLKKERRQAKQAQKAKQRAQEISQAIDDKEKEILRQQKEQEKAIEERIKQEQKAIAQAQKDAQKQQRAYEKSLKKQQKAEQKAIAQAQKMAEKDRKTHEKLASQYSAETESGFKKFISKLKFWKKK